MEKEVILFKIIRDGKEIEIPIEEITTEEFKRLTVKQKSDIIAQMIVNNLNNPLNHDQS